MGPVMQCPSKGQFCLCWQLQVCLDVTVVLLLELVVIFLLCDCMILFMFLVQLYESLMQFLLTHFLSLLFFGKCFSISDRKSLPMLVATSMLYGGLNHTVSLFLLAFSLFACC